MNIKRFIKAAVLPILVLLISWASVAQTPPPPDAIKDGTGFTYNGTHKISEHDFDSGVSTTSPDGTKTTSYKDGWKKEISKPENGTMKEVTTDTNGRMMEEKNWDVTVDSAGNIYQVIHAHTVRVGSEVYKSIYDKDGKTVASHSEESTSYDDQGRLTYDRTFYFDSNNKLISGEKLTYEYSDEKDTNPIIIHSNYDQKNGFVVDTPKKLIDELREQKEAKKNYDKQIPDAEDSSPLFIRDIPGYMIDSDFDKKTPNLMGWPPEMPKDEPGYKSKTSFDSGLDKTNFILPNGSSITVNLPNDMAAGDTITGTVQVVPSGKTEAEQAANTADLNGTVTVEIAGRQTGVLDRTINRVISATPTAEDQLVILFIKGKRVATTRMPISSAPLQISTQTKLPTIIQQNKPFQISYPGNGAFSPNNYVKVGGTPVPVLAASPRQATYLNTSPSLGATEIECNQGGVITRGPVSNIGVQLSAKKLNLLRGETTELLAKGIGFNGITENVPYDLVVTPPAGIINMSGGNFQQGVIQPNQVQPDGTVAMTRTLTGITPGGWGITFTVRPKQHPFPAKRGEGDKKTTENGGGAGIRNVSDTTTKDKTDAAQKKVDEKKKALEAARETEEKAYRAAMDSADKEKVKAWEGAFGEFVDASREAQKAWLQFHSDESDENKQAAVDADQKKNVKWSKEKAAWKAVEDSMDPEKKAAWEKAKAEMQSTLDEWNKALDERDAANEKVIK